MSLQWSVNFDNQPRTASYGNIPTIPPLTVPVTGVMWDPSTPLNVDLPPNLDPILISVGVCDMSGSPVDIGSLVSNFRIMSSLGDYVDAQLSTLYEFGITNVLMFQMSRSSGIPMPITYTLTDASGTFSGLPPITICYGGVKVETSNTTLDYGSAGSVNVRFFQDAECTVQFSPMAGLNMISNIRGSYIRLYDNLGASFSFENNAQNTYDSSTSTITYIVSDTHPNLGAGKKRTLTYTAHASGTAAANLLYLNMTSASIIYNGTGTSSTVPCFFGDAQVLTPFGYERIDSFVPGDLVTTSNGVMMIRKVKMYTVEASPETNPYMIPKGMFNATRDILISPDHCVKVGDKMVPAKELGLEQQMFDGILDYYNIEFDEWYSMFVSGVEVESLAPVKSGFVSVEFFNQVLKSYSDKMRTDLQHELVANCKFHDNGIVEFPILKRV
jgi:hypothetical protein